MRQRTYEPEYNEAQEARRRGTMQKCGLTLSGRSTDDAQRLSAVGERSDPNDGADVSVGD